MKDRWYLVGLIALVGGLVHLTLSGYLYQKFGYYAEYGLTATQLFGMFSLGVLTVGLFAYTRLLVPLLGLLALLAGAVNYEIFVSAPPEFPTAHFRNYVHYWYTWVALLVIGGVAELGIRSGYALGDQRLRNLPAIPMSMRKTIVISVGAGALFSISLYLLSLQTGLELYLTADRWMAIAGGFIVISTTTWGVLSYGLIVPLVLSIMWVGFTVPQHLVGRGRATSFSIFIYLGAILVFAALIELVVRTKWLRFLNGRNF